MDGVERGVHRSLSRHGDTIGNRVLHALRQPRLRHRIVRRATRSAPRAERRTARVPQLRPRGRRAVPVSLRAGHPRGGVRRRRRVRRPGRHDPRAERPDGVVGVHVRRRDRYGDARGRGRGRGRINTPRARHRGGWKYFCRIRRRVGGGSVHNLAGGDVRSGHRGRARGSRGPRRGDGREP